MAEFAVSDAELGAAISGVMAAERIMIDENATRPTSGFESMTGIADEIDLYLRGLQVARAALADAAKTSGRGLRDLMESVGDLDSQVAHALNSGFAVRR